jgi:hypothetical protein
MIKSSKNVNADAADHRKKNFKNKRVSLRPAPEFKPDSTAEDDFTAALQKLLTPDSIVPRDICVVFRDPSLNIWAHRGKSYVC